MIIYLTAFILAIAAAGTAIAPGDGRLFPGARAAVKQFFEWFGEFGVFTSQVFRTSLLPPYEFRELLRQLYAVGPQSLPLVALAGSATGVVMSLQMRDSLSRLGAKTMLPAVIVYSVIKEMAPIITGLVVSGRVGAGISAELGSMKVTEQIDAMEVSAVDPYKFLAAPRILACILMLPLLTLAADFCGITMGWITTTMMEPISLRLFMDHGLKGAVFNDLIPPTLKTAVFGLIIGLVATFQGMRTRGGTAGVGRSVTISVVLCSLFIILADVILVRVIQVFFT
jgi:phospholipid/cholesterol/gamma-HCH transport system permease protein